MVYYLKFILSKCLNRWKKRTCHEHIDNIAICLFFSVLMTISYQGLYGKARFITCDVLGGALKWLFVNCRPRIISFHIFLSLITNINLLQLLNNYPLIKNHVTSILCLLGHLFFAIRLWFYVRCVINRTLQLHLSSLRIIEKYSLCLVKGRMLLVLRIWHQIRAVIFINLNSRRRYNFH